MRHTDLCTQDFIELVINCFEGFDRESSHKSLNIIF